MEKDIARWIKECGECFLTNPRKVATPPLRPVVTNKPFEIVAVDLLEMGLSANGMKYVLVVVDHFSKWLGAYALPDKTASSIATTLFQRWICENGRWPRQIHSDQGTEFVNSVMDELAKVAGITLSTTKGYNSRENGVCERAIGTIQKILKKKVHLPELWDNMLPNAVYAYNVTPHEATGESPFFLLYGFDPYVPSEVIPEGRVTQYQVDWDDYKTELLRGMQLIREHVREYADKYRERMKKSYDKRHSADASRLPTIGSRVFMKLPAEKSKSKYPKLTNEWDGPFRVLDASETSALISRIGADEEPLRIQMDMLRVCPEELTLETVVTKTRRRQRQKRGRVRASRVTVVDAAQLNTSICCHFRAVTEFEVPDSTHCLHGQFRCVGQQMPLVPGVPQLPPPCRVSTAITAGQIIPELPEPAYSHRVENVLEAARIIAVWQGCGTLAEKITWIADPAHRRISPRSVALAYAFFRSRCMHVAIMASTVPSQGIMRHAPIPGWGCDMVHIFELAWTMACRISWNDTTQKMMRMEHRKAVFIVPHNLRTLKRVNGWKDTIVFYYRMFKEIHLRRTELFDDNLGIVVIVLPSVEPRPGSWLPLVHAVNMWLACGCRVCLIAGPRTQDESSWFRVAEQARKHVNGFLEGHVEYMMQIVDKLPVMAGAMDTASPCFAVAITEDEHTPIPERQARLFYEMTRRQLQPWASLECIPEMPPRKHPAVRHQEPVGHGQEYAAIKEGRVQKRAERRKEQRKRRSQMRAAAKELSQLNVTDRKED
ncbi:hypothetical protein Y032_0030g2085 [Ancylostoma ceylanicum]|nr:hypothetical protein Y032_0030g2085 [Ancylostoma ceylanicum]